MTVSSHLSEDNQNLLFYSTFFLERRTDMVCNVSYIQEVTICVVTKHITPCN